MSLVQPWLRAIFLSRSSRKPRARAFKPFMELLEDRQLLSTVSLQLGNVVAVASYAEVGFRENVVANGLKVSVNGQPDSNNNDFQAQVNWGDGSSSEGDLVYTGSDAVSSEYLIKGSHIYSQTGTNIPITVTVTGPGGANTSALTAYAAVAPMASGIPGTPPPNSQATAPANVQLQLGNIVSTNSYAGVGFVENVVANGLDISVNGQPDVSTTGIHAYINWGDSASWTSADLVLTGSDSTRAFYTIKGSHIYAQQANGIPIVVYVSGPDGTSTSALTAYADVAPMPSGLPGTPPPASANSTGPANVQLQLGNVVAINAYAGVGFVENVVANGLDISVNGQPDMNSSGIHAEINWGDSSSWTPAELVLTGSDSTRAFYNIEGSHTYGQPGTNIPIVVYVNGPDGTSTSALTAYADVAQMPGGQTPANLNAVAMALTHSGEFYSDFITNAYQQYLGRMPSTAEVNGWVTDMQNGMSDEAVEASFIGSPEYIANHGGAGAGWVIGMYQNLLGRTPSQAEVNGWVQNLNNGESTTAVAYGFAASPEREGDRVAADYQKYLGRAASQAEINGWVAAFAAGTSNESVIAGFVGSTEFWQVNGSNAPQWLDAAYQEILNRPADAAADAAWLPLL